MADAPISSDRDEEERTTTSPAAGLRGHLGSASALTPGTVLSGRFRLVRLLGKGGSGMVWSAVDIAVGQRVAVKILHPEVDHERNRERLRREVRAVRPGHPNAVAVYDLFEGDDAVLLSMELVEGESLREKLARHGRLEVEEVVSVGRQVASALGHLHAKGLVHRDVKPGNVLLARDGVVKLCDMGLTRPVEQGTTVTETEVVVGTPAFMAPEQGAGKELSPAADIYALGLTLFCCLSGKVPFQEGSAVATLVRRQRERPPGVRRARPDCPRWLERLLRLMLEPDPHARPSADRVVRALDSGRVLWRPRRRTLLRLAVGALVALAAVAGGRERWERRTVRVEIGDRAVYGVDTRGRSTWSHELESPIRQDCRGDLDRDGVDEVVVVSYPDWNQRHPLALSEVLVVTQRGRVLTRARPEELVTEWQHPFQKRFAPRARLLDLDGDGGAELVLACRHHAFYPCELVVFWPRQQAWTWVLDHAGWVYDVAAVPGAEPPAFRFLAVNNRLGMLTVVGEIALRTPAGGAGKLDTRTALRIAEGGTLVAATAELTAYVPLALRGDDSQAPFSLSVLPDGGTRVSSGGEVTLDRFGNPVPGPNAGRDLRRLRLSLLPELVGLSPAELPGGPELVVDAVDACERRLGPLLAEAPYRAIVDIAAARALAQACELATARQRLERTLAVLPFEDVAYQLAQLDAVAGDLDKAIARLRRLTEGAVTRRGTYDAPQLMIRLAIERRDRGLLEGAVELLTLKGVGLAAQPGLRTAISARADLWWDAIREPDLVVQSWPYAPDGEAIGCLARWRLGRGGADDLERMLRARESFPDSAAEATVALAAVELSLGRGSEAVERLDVLLSTLELDGKHDFMSLQLAQLARAVRGKALLGAGKPEEARREAGQLLATATPDLLPAFLAREVLEATTGGPAGS